MGRYLTAQGFRQHAAAARRGRAHRQRWRAARARGRAGLRPQPGRCLDLDARPVQPRARRPRDAAKAAPKTRGRPGRRLRRRSPPRSASGSARCTRCWRGHSDDPAFAPETAGDARRRRAGPARAVALLERAFGAAEAADRMGQRDGRSAGRSVCCRSSEPLIARAMRDWRKPASGRAMTRIHGDFHLGQVLVASGDVYIIDFEGEPGRPLAERRAKTSPLRDVAGLLRSFDYAAAATLDPKKLDRGARAGGAARRVHHRACATARSALPRRLSRRPSRQERRQRAPCSTFFLIEKAAYELAYEAANRPAWLPIPLNGLARLAARIQRTTRSDAMNVACRCQPSRRSIAARSRRSRTRCTAIRSPCSARTTRRPDRSSAPFCPAPRRSRCCARSDRARLGRLASEPTAACFRASSASARPTCCASPGRAACRRPRIPIRSDRCSAISICICSTRAATSSSRDALGANVTTIDGVRGTRFAVWAPNAGASPSSAISTPGTRGATRCGCATRRRLGAVRAARRPGARYKFDIARRRTACACRRRPIRCARQTELPPATASVVASPSRSAGATTTGCARARAATRPTRRSRSTRCISAHGCGRRMTPQR